MKITANPQPKNPKKKRKRNWALILIIVIVFLATILVGLCRFVFFPINFVTVIGNSVYKASLISDASGIAAGDKLFSVNSKSVCEKIQKDLPYVKSAEVKRILPDKIEISVTETCDMFYYEKDGKFIITDVDNKVLRIEDSAPEGLTLISVGEDITASVGSRLSVNSDKEKLIRNLYDLLSAQEIKVQDINVSNISGITVKVLDRFTVKLGTSDFLEYKINHLSTMVKQINASNGEQKTGVIDLSAWSTDKREGYFSGT